MEHSHSEDAIRERLSDGPPINYLRDWVYGGIDGTITTFAIVAGVVGAELSTRVILILGLANIIADGFSMAASNYSGTKTEVDEYKRLRTFERRQIDREPDGERQEVRQAFANKGFEGADLERAVEIITADKDRWVETMMTEEYGMPPGTRSPTKAAVYTFANFVVCGMVPLLPFFLMGERAFEVAIAATAVVFFAIGSIKSRWSLAPWWRSGTETLVIGMAAAILSYGIGWGLKSLL
jgi:VIT1/CCC1 family predicted Fe2+/Mn2+ transporter